MSDNHTTNTSLNTNSGAKSGSRPTKDFNQARQQQAYELTQLSQEAQQKAAMMEDVYSKRLAKERNDQQRSRSYRELKEKNKLLENYVRDNAPRPNDPQARENDLQIIDKSAKEAVANRENYYIGQIERERFEVVETIIQEEKQKQAGLSDYAHGSHETQGAQNTQSTDATPSIEPEQDL